MLVAVEIHSRDGAGGALALEGTSECLSTAQGAVDAQPLEGGEDTAMPAGPGLGALKIAVTGGWMRMPARRTSLHRCSGDGVEGGRRVLWLQGPAWHLSLVGFVLYAP